jgi:hypothetical protein
MAIVGVAICLQNQPQPACNPNQTPNPKRNVLHNLLVVVEIRGPTPTTNNLKNKQPTKNFDLLLIQQMSISMWGKVLVYEQIRRVH